MSTWRVTPFDVGLCTLGENHVLGDDYSDDDRMGFALYAFLLQDGAGRNILVDLGPKMLGYTNDMFRRYNFFRTMPDGSTPDDIVQRYGNALDWLQRIGLRPEEITDVVFTHMHADHHGMDDARDGGMCEDFPNAKFHASKIGWDFNVTQRVDGHWNSYLDWGFGDFMLRMEREGRAVFADNAEVAPGVSTIYLGGHAICSQAVYAETDTSPVIITSDDVYRYDLLERGVMARLYTTPDALLEGTRRLAESAKKQRAIVLPVHDPIISDLYRERGDGWLAEAEKLSRRAVDGFLSVRG